MTTQANAVPSHHRRRVWAIGAGLLSVVAIAFGVGESLGWPFLSAPIQRALQTVLDRTVRLSDGDKAPERIRVGLLGRIRVQAAYLEIGAASWSHAPYTLLARDAALTLTYGDLWRAWRGAPLHIHSLDAASLDGRLERLADGRSAWQFGASPKTKTAPAPTIGILRVGDGRVRYDDAMLETNLDARFSIVDGAGPASPASAPAGLQLTASGTYRKLPATIEVKTDGVLPLFGDAAATVALPVKLRLQVGRARMSFDGTATDALNFGQLRGRFDVQGPSLAAVGDPLGVTLPSTAAFRTRGLIVKEDQVWRTVVEKAEIGSSQLAAALSFDPRGGRRLLSGRLTGNRLLLADLGPAIGAPVRTGAVAAAPDVPPVPATPRKAGKLLPDRPFDLPALRAMDANVVIDIDDLDLGSKLLQPMRPLRTHLVLADGVLTLRDIDARTAQGQVAGQLELDGRQALALWKADLRWDGVRLESWLKQTRSDGAPPYIAGRLNGIAHLAGQGRSTAAILGSLEGQVRMALFDGKVSHLAVEAAGLDVAQALGVFIKGDDALPIDCTVADLVAERGQLKPRALLVDTVDSTVWIDGSLSLATEAMDLRVVVTPKDFSPLALRTPIHVQGTFADAKVSVEKASLGVKAGAAAALALINPLAAVIPFFDFGADDEARSGAAKCRVMAERSRVALSPTSRRAPGSPQTPSMQPAPAGQVLR